MSKLRNPTILGVWRLEGWVELSPTESNWRLVFVSTLTDSEPGAGAATAEQLSRNYEGRHTFTLNIELERWRRMISCVDLCHK